MKLSFIGATNEENARPLLKINRESDYDWIMADMLNSRLSKYSAFVLEVCVSEMKLRLIDKIDNSSPTQRCAEREGDT